MQRFTCVRAKEKIIFINFVGGTLFIVFWWYLLLLFGNYLVYPTYKDTTVITIPLSALLIVDFLLSFVVYKTSNLSRIFLYVVGAVHLAIICLFLYIPYALDVYFQDFRNVVLIILIMIYLYFLSMWRRKLSKNNTRGVFIDEKT